jgi:SpoIID/LytB domain protein
MLSSMSKTRVCVLAAVLLAVISFAPPAGAQTKTFTFRGRGWGHGVGLVQWGARGLAEKGLTASAIVKHYYSGTEVEPKTLPSNIRVGLLQERAEIWIEADGAFELFDSAGAKKATGNGDGRWRVVPDGSTLKVFAPGASSPKFTSSPPVTAKFEHLGTRLDLPQTGYEYKRGKLEVGLNTTTKKTRAVLVLPFEAYLYGLGEMPSSWHTEALEAQAIAGRTYALEKTLRLGQHRSVCDCAVYATTADQAYVGVQHEVTRWVSAVNTTKGLVATYQDKPIQAYYSSSSGGFTENNENVFGGTPLPYLRGKCDYGDYFNGTNPHSNWTVSMTSTSIGDEMADAGRNVGPVTSISYPAPRGVSGRLGPVIDSTRGGVVVSGSLGREHISGGTFRSILGFKSSLVHWHIYGGIRERWDALKCAPGLPKYNEVAFSYLDGTKKGRSQNFTKGRLFFNPDLAKVFWTKGAILAHYDARRKAGQDLGLATTDELGVTGGRASYFERGRIYHSDATKAHAVVGAILKKYVDTGGPKKWGLPTTDELSAPGGRSARFQKCRIYWTSKHGAHPVYGAILTRYIAEGAGASKLGLPTNDEHSITGGRRQDFQHGYITWNSSTGKTSVKLV